MKPIVYIPLILLGFLSCKNDKTAPMKHVPDEAITPLPFGPKIKGLDEFYNGSTVFYYGLMGKEIGADHPVYNATRPLPKIDKLTYTPIEPEDKCETGGFEFHTYNNRLPDLGKWQVYYATGSNGGANRNTACEGLGYQIYGHLILYDSATKSAKAIPIFYERYIDAPRTRKFYIDAKYEIYISHDLFIEDEDGAEKSIVDGYKLSLSKHGNVSISKIFDTK